MIDQPVWEGVNALLDDYAQVREGDVAVVAYTPDGHQSAAWVSVALELRGIPVKLVPMSPLVDLSLAERLSAALPSPSKLAGRLIIMTFELETMSHTDVFREAMSIYDTSRCSVIRAMSACPELFSQALRVTPSQLSAFNAAVLDRCMPARSLRVVSPGGTDLRIGLDLQRFRWVSTRGVSHPGAFTIIPSGEVATYPASIDGVLVADFALHVNRTIEFDVRLQDHPITVTVKDGNAVDYQCSNGEISRFLDECFSTDGSRAVGELGFGTNAAVTVPTKINSHINERKPGVHLGFGQHNQRGVLPVDRCIIHLDLITHGGNIWTDDDPVPLDLINIVPFAGDHPSNVDDEDVFSPD